MKEYVIIMTELGNIIYKENVINPITFRVLNIISEESIKCNSLLHALDYIESLEPKESSEVKS